MSFRRVTWSVVIWRFLLYFLDPLADEDYACCSVCLSICAATQFLRVGLSGFCRYHSPMVLMSEHNRALPKVLRQDDSIRAEAKLAIGLSDFQHCPGNLIKGLTRSSKATTQLT